MKIDVIINPKRGIISGIHKAEGYIISIINKIEPSVNIIPVNEVDRPALPLRLLYLFLNIFIPAFNSKNSRKTGEVLYFSDQQLSLLLNFIKINKKIVIMVYDVFPATEFYKTRLSFFERYRYGLIIKALKKADRLITTTRMVKKELVKLFDFDADKIDVVYLGIDRSIYYPRENVLDFKKRLGLSDEDKIVLCVSSEEPRKNIDGLIMAFKELVKMIPACKLIKIGRAGWPGAREKFLKVIAESGLNNNVIIKENVPEEEMPFYYSMADVFVNIPLYEGGWAISVLEAMSCGCPVVASKPALEELAGGYGVLVELDDCKKIAEIIKDILTDKKKSNLLRKKSMDRAQMFSWHKTAEEIISIIKGSSSRA